MKKSLFFDLYLNIFGFFHVANFNAQIHNEASSDDDEDNDNNDPQEDHSVAIVILLQLYWVADLHGKEDPTSRIYHIGVVNYEEDISIYELAVGGILGKWTSRLIKRDLHDAAKVVAAQTCTGLIEVIEGLRQTFLTGAINIGDILKGTAMHSKAFNSSPNVALVSIIGTGRRIGKC